MNINFEIDETMQRMMQGLTVTQLRKLWTAVANNVWEKCEPYTPRQQGTMHNTAIRGATSSGGYILYTAPYSHYQYYGQVMGPNTLTENGWRSFHAPKHYTGEPLTYGGGALRGSKWDSRMWADHKNDIMHDISVAVVNSWKY